MQPWSGPKVPITLAALPRWMAIDRAWNRYMTQNGGAPFVLLDMERRYTMLILWFVISLFILKNAVAADRPCAARAVDGQSVVCVCNATYCDSFAHAPPDDGKYVTYTSTKDGLRFEKTTGDLEDASEIESSCCSINLAINPDTQYQTIEGFGGAVTDAAGINWKSLSETAQDNLIQSYCSDSGLKYNILRVPIGGCDFSTRAYTLNDLPEDDKDLSNFTLAPEDINYKLPMIKACMRAASSDLKIIGTTWSPPVWMKSNGKISGFSRLKTEYYLDYALYHLKFLQKYKENNVSAWGITTTNEPMNGVIPLANFNSLGWTPSTMAKWIAEYLGPTIRNNSEFKDVKILACDDQRFAIPIWFNQMIKSDNRVLDYIDGVAVHFYWDNIVPSATLKFVTDNYPSKFLLATEACEGTLPWDKGVKLGSWSRAENYVKDIIEDLANGMVGWIDWNLCLNSAGGPNWAGNFVDSSIIVDAEKDEFYKQPMFYALGHFSKFVTPGSRRVKVTRNSLFSLDNVAFSTPNGTIVIVLYNGGRSRKVRLQVKDKAIQLNVAAHSITTVEMLL
ncbi:Glucosylceramidase [Eumeta japonica]|uniref:Glucosylceramidase n=1 Tax=Eumeta variegata TaxID=151549 RepID=A0A4C1W0T6_EUMVA|nr:Glucosylceramidase [Eumeta japonica]